MTKLALIFLGGGLGSVLRYLISHYTAQSVKSGIPFGTLVVNIIGSLLFGLIIGYFHKNQGLGQQMVFLLTIGFCGGFTTFSTFSYENFLMIKEGQFGAMFIYTLVSVTLGIAAVWAGWLITTR
jgi:CrcB protein